MHLQTTAVCVTSRRIVFLLRVSQEAVGDKSTAGNRNATISEPGTTAKLGTSGSCANHSNKIERDVLHKIGGRDSMRASVFG